MRNLVIFLDPAHGSDIKGKRSPDGTHREYKWSRKITSLLKEGLENEGFKVIITNPQDIEIGLVRRKNLVNTFRVEPHQTKLLVSIHNNAAGNGSNWMSARGFEIWTTKGQTKSDAIAQIVFENLVKDFPQIPSRPYNLRKASKEANFTVLTGSSYYAFLLEWLFQDNRLDVELLKDDKVNSSLVNSLVKSLVYIDKHLDKLFI